MSANGGKIAEMKFFRQYITISERIMKRQITKEYHSVSPSLCLSVYVVVGMDK
jgi:hypothetical protein